MTPTKKQPLFIITGASGVGKSTMCEILFQDEIDYIVMESDLLWHDIHNTPQDNYHNYRKLWMNVCANISQIAKPVVLCGCATPEQFENQEERVLFSDIHYLAVVCDKVILETHMRTGRGITDEGWIESSVNFNQWLINNAHKTKPQITLLDTTGLTPKQAAEIVHNWITERM